MKKFKDPEAEFMYGYDYCATEADEMLESHDDLEEVLEWCLDHA